jgi:transposase
VFFAGIDAHTRYVVVVVLDRMGERVLAPTRVKVEQRARLLDTLAPFRPLDATMETSSSWPWLHEVLTAAGIRFVLAHARRLRAIAEANYKADAIDAELLARMRLAGLIPVVYPTPVAQREWATLVRHRTTLVAQRTALVNRIHAQLHCQGLHLARGRLLTRAGRQWVRTEAYPVFGLEHQRARARGRLARHARPAELAHALLRDPEGARGLADGARGHGAEAGAGAPRDAPHADAMAERTDGTDRTDRHQGTGSGEPLV